jgi:hypothetical protein
MKMKVKNTYIKVTVLAITAVEFKLGMEMIWSQNFMSLHLSWTRIQKIRNSRILKGFFFFAKILLHREALYNYKKKKISVT